MLPCNFHTVSKVLGGSIHYINFCTFNLLKNRIYLTDATPDNIVVDTSSFDITFVDLDSIFVVDSETIMNKQKIHRHEKIDCEGNCFAYVPEDLCSHHLSDINLFAVCQVVVLLMHLNLSI